VKQQIIAVLISVGIAVTIPLAITPPLSYAIELFIQFLFRAMPKSDSAENYSREKKHSHLHFSDEEQIERDEERRVLVLA
jgi:hypothetical protein